MGRKRFTNPHVADTRKKFWNFLLWRLGYYDEKTPREPMPEDFYYPGSIENFDPAQPKAIWIGHSTYLIEIDGVNILTDPVWDEYCSPIPIRALRRYTPPPIALSDLPPIDLVLISHNHYDHLDAKTVKELSRFHPQIEWIVPEGLSGWFKRRNIDSVKELPWWEKSSLKGGSVTAVPTQHFSGRGLFDTNRTHWNGYVLELFGKKIYFSGDTGYNPEDFRAIGAHFQHMDISFIPIGTYIPKVFMEPVHISPFEAVQIHQDVGSRLSLGMHWNTFHLSDEPRSRPPFDLFLAMQEKKLPFETFLPVEIGTYVNF